MFILKFELKSLKFLRSSRLKLLFIIILLGLKVLLRDIFDAIKKSDKREREVDSIILFQNIISVNIVIYNKNKEVIEKSIM